MKTRSAQGKADQLQHVAILFDHEYLWRPRALRRANAIRRALPLPSVRVDGTKRDGNGGPHGESSPDCGIDQ
jgi:hypothetical protein